MADIRIATGKIKVGLQATLQNLLSNGVVTAAAAQGAANIVDLSPSSGAEADKFNRIYDLTVALTSGQTYVLDVYAASGVDIGAGAGKDALGQDVTFQEIVAIAIKQTAGAGSLEIEPDASAGWTPIGTHTVATGGALTIGGALIKIKPDEAAFDVAPAVTHRIKFTANGGACTFRCVIAARHDDEVSSSSSSTSSSLSSSSTTSSLSSSSSSTSSSRSTSSTSSLSSSSSSTSSLSTSSTSTLSSSSSSLSTSSLSSSSTSSESSSSSSST